MNFTQQESWKKLNTDQKIRALTLIGWMTDKNIDNKQSIIAKNKTFKKKLIVLVDLFPFILNNKLNEIEGRLSRSGLKPYEVQYIGVMDSFIPKYNEETFWAFVNKALTKKWIFAYDIGGMHSPEVIKQISDEYLMIRKNVIIICNDKRFGVLNCEECGCVDLNLNKIERNEERFIYTEPARVRNCFNKKHIKVWIDTLIQYGLYT